MKDPEGWHTLSAETVYKSPHLEVVHEKVRLAGEGHVREWTTVRRKKAVVIAPVTAAGNYVLIHQARIPVRHRLWEFPAGQIDESFDPPQDLIRLTARRELTEETGYELSGDGELIELGHFFSSQGLTDETQHLFLARPVYKNEAGWQHEKSEAIAECREFTPDELRSAVSNLIIQDGNSLAIFARLVAKGLLE